MEWLPLGKEFILSKQDLWHTFLGKCLAEMRCRPVFLSPWDHLQVPSKLNYKNIWYEQWRVRFINYFLMQFMKGETVVGVSGSRMQDQCKCVLTRHFKDLGTWLFLSEKDQYQWFSLSWYTSTQCHFWPSHYGMRPHNISNIDQELSFSWKDQRFLWKKMRAQKRDRRRKKLTSESEALILHHPTWSSLLQGNIFIPFYEREQRG